MQDLRVQLENERMSVRQVEGLEKELADRGFSYLFLFSLKVGWWT